MLAERVRPDPARPRVLLMATCLCDAFFDGAAAATVEVLEWAGCAVEFPEAQTCCGQPAFNGGDWAASRRVVRHTAGVFAGDLPVVVPSASCAGMLRHGAPLEFEKENDRGMVDALAGRTWELCDFLVNALGITKWPGRLPVRAAFHRSCHSRGTASGDAALTLLGSIDALVLAPFGEAEQCCGFGGTFSVGFPNISSAMGELKLSHIRESQPDLLVSGDLSCLMHLAGLAERDGKPVKIAHVAEVLRDSLAHARIINAA